MLQVVDGAEAELCIGVGVCVCLVRLCFFCLHWEMVVWHYRLGEEFLPLLRSQSQVLEHVTHVSVCLDGGSNTCFWG